MSVTEQLGNGSRADRLANSVWMTLSARAAMLVCAIAGPLLASYVVNVLSESAKTLREAATELRLLSQRVDFNDQKTASELRLRDQRLDQVERRIGVLERPGASTAR